jgi:hypothetical protein
LNPENNAMNLVHPRRLVIGLGFLAGWLLVLSPGRAETDFAKKQEEIREQLEARRERGRDLVRNRDVLDPPMIDAAESDLADDEPVIGVSIGGEARAYPLTMLFGGGGIFELLNDTCGGEPIAASW